MGVAFISILDCGKGGSCNTVTWPPSLKTPSSKLHSLSLNTSADVSPMVLLVTGRKRLVEEYRKGIRAAKAFGFGLLLKSLGGERGGRSQ